ncbi:MAG TPA: ATP-binding protein [Candidatus Limnocylindrales bacterium]|nr:ATP-binding protein [Candidatus Limnocylindrales bacterium]
MDPFTFVFQALYYVVFGASVVRFWRRRGRLELAVVSVFAPMAVVFAVSALGSVVPGASATLRPFTTAVLLLQPILVLRLASLIRPIPRWVMPAVWLGFVVNVIGFNVSGGAPGWILSYVAFFFLAEIAGGWRLFQDARRRYGLARIRLGLAGVATACFGMAILIAGIGSAAAGGSGAQVAGVTAVSRFLALAAGIGYLAAFLPPRWARRLAQQSMAFGVTRSLVVAPEQSGPELLWAELARAAREILGARSIELRADGRTGPLATLGDADVAALVPRPVDTRPTTVTRIRVPLEARSGWSGEIIADVDGRPLFVEDDIALLEQLGSLTAHTVERLDAFIRLEEAQRSLAEAAAVRASEARFRVLLDADPNAILALDTAGTVTWATRQAELLFGYESDSMIGVRLTELVPVPDGSLAPPVPDARGVLRAETTARRRDGTHFPAEIAQTKFELDGELFHVAVISDVSWREEADQIRERFVGVLSHELRTPVTSIYGGAQLLLTRGSRLDKATRDDLLTTIADESERLQRIIENLVVLARIERGTELGGPRPVLLDRLLADLLARERTLWPSGTIRLTVEAPLPVVAADDDHIGQIVRNLISNAAKYAGEGATVDVTARLEGDEVVVRVHDDGPGIAASEADRLFTLYYRSSEHSAVAGAGMGLFVCQQLVQSMGGRIWAARRSEGGSEFGFSVPVFVDEHADAEDQPPPSVIRALPSDPEATLVAPAVVPTAPAGGVPADQEPTGETELAASTSA